MFSGRIPSDLTPNRLSRAVQRRRAEGRPLIDLTESNATRVGFEYPPDLLEGLADPRGLSYQPRPFGSLEARGAVAREYARRGATVAPERIVLTASTSEAYALLFKLLADAGDQVLVPRPSYPLFDHLTRLELVEPRGYDLEYHGAWSIDFASVERVCTSRTRAVLVVSPNNPTGSFVGRDEIERLATLCAGRGAAIIADEVFADYELTPGAAAAAGSVAAVTGALAFSLGGLSKSVGLPQVKLGWLAVSGPDALVGAALDRLELVCDTYLSVSTPVQCAAPELLERGAGVRAQIAARVAANYRRLQHDVSTFPAVRVLAADAGWYAVLQVPTLQSEDDLVVSLVEEAGVLTHPGYFFDFPKESFLVLSLLPSESVFSDALVRLLRHVDCPAASHE